MNNEASTTVAELERARDNGDVRVRIVLGNDEEETEEIARALRSFRRRNTTTTRQRSSSNLCSVSLVGCDIPNANGTGWEIPNLLPVLTAIQEDLPEIVHVQFENSSINGWTLRACVLSNFLQVTRLRLQTLDFTALRVEGTRNELQQLDSAMSRLVCLRGFCLQNNFLLWVKDDREIYPLDDMLEGMAKLPLLQEIYIDLDYWNDDDAHSKQLRSSSNTLRTILNSSNNTIQDIFLGKIDPTHSSCAIQDIAKALMASSSTTTMSRIRFLSLQFKPQQQENSSATEDTTAAAAAAAAETDDNNNNNNNTITKTTKKSSSFATSLECLAKALRVNTSLQELRLSFGNDQQKCPTLDPFLVQVAEELSRNPNTSLTKLEVVSPNNYGVVVEEAYVKLLRTNYTLMELEFYSSGRDGNNNDIKYVSLDGCHRTEMHLYLSLNSDNRKSLMSTYQRKPWVDALVTYSHNLDALFYYLQINPWLMSPPDNSSAAAAASDATIPPRQPQRQQQQKKRRRQHQCQLVSLPAASVSASGGEDNNDDDVVVDVDDDDDDDDDGNSSSRKIRRLEDEIERLKRENEALLKQQQQQQPTTLSKRSPKKKEQQQQQEEGPYSFGCVIM